MTRLLNKPRQEFVDTVGIGTYLKMDAAIKVNWIKFRWKQVRQWISDWKNQRDA